MPDEFGGPYVQKEEDLITPWGVQTRTYYSYDPSGTNNRGFQPDIFCASPKGIICNWSNKFVQQ